MNPEARWTGNALVELLQQAHRVHASVTVRVDDPGDPWVVEISAADWTRPDGAAQEALLSALRAGAQILEGLSSTYPTGIPSGDEIGLAGAELLTVSGHMQSLNGGFSMSAAFPAAAPAYYTVHAYYQRQPKFRYRNASADTLLGAFAGVREKLAEQDVHVPPVAV